jgi:hypothetical protein
MEDIKNPIENAAELLFETIRNLGYSFIVFYAGIYLRYGPLEYQWSNYVIGNLFQILGFLLLFLSIGVFVIRLKRKFKPILAQVILLIIGIVIFSSFSVMFQSKAFDDKLPIKEMGKKR